jgi:protein ImuB
VPDLIAPPTSLATKPHPPIPHGCLSARLLYACLYRPPAADSSAGVGLVDIAADFSPRYERHNDDLVSIDLTGLQRLLGPAPAIAEELRRAAVSRQLSLHIAVASTRMAAVVLALARPGISVVARGDEAAALAAVPLGVLAAVSQNAECRISDCRLQIAVLQTFAKWGLRTLGELAALPAADLAARFGPSARIWQAIARGEDVRPLIPTLPDERFVSTLDLEWPIEELEPLSFVVTRLLEPLSTRLERRDRGAAVLHVILDLVTRRSTSSHRGEPVERDTYARRLELPSPMRDVRTLRTLALLDLEAHPPPAAIDRVTIVIDPTPGRVLQHTLFTRAVPTPEQLSTLVARLGALMGADRFGAPVVVDSYRPGAFAMAPFATDHERNRRNRRERRAASNDVAAPANSACVDAGDGSNPGDREEVAFVQALRRCRHPVPARVAVDNGRPVRVTTDRRGFAGGVVTRSAGPWRTSGNWWSGETGTSEVRSQKSEGLRTSDFRRQTSAWDRDEWDVSLNDGGVYRIFRDRETDAWFIDAIVD